MDTRSHEIVRLTSAEFEALPPDERRHFLPLTEAKAAELSGSNRAARRAWAVAERKRQRKERRAAERAGVFLQTPAVDHRAPERASMPNLSSLSTLASVLAIVGEPPRMSITVEGLDKMSGPLQGIVDALDKLPRREGSVLAPTADESETETCEGCRKVLPFDQMKHDAEFVPLCAECYADCLADPASRVDDDVELR